MDPSACRTKVGPLSRIQQSSIAAGSSSTFADTLRRASLRCSGRTSISTGSNSTTAFATPAC